VPRGEPLQLASLGRHVQAGIRHPIHEPPHQGNDALCRVVREQVKLVGMPRAVENGEVQLRPDLTVVGGKRKHLALTGLQWHALPKPADVAPDGSRLRSPSKRDRHFEASGCEAHLSHAQGRIGEFHRAAQRAGVPAADAQAYP